MIITKLTKFNLKKYIYLIVVFLLKIQTIHAQIDLTRQLTIYTEKGIVTFDEIMTIVKEFYHANPTLKVLWDSREGTISGVSFKKLEKIAEFVCEMEQKAGIVKKTAVVICKDIDYGYSRMAQTFLDIYGFKPEYRIFRWFEDALAWLDE